MRFIATAFAIVWFLCGANFKGAPKVYLERAEEARKELAIFWTGKEFPEWEMPCKMTIRERRQDVIAGGATTFSFVDGEVTHWRMTLEGSKESILQSAIPHEVNHMIMACLARRPITRWVDEGVAALFESPMEHKRHRETSKKLLNHPWATFKKFDNNLTSYPQSGTATAAMYSTSFSVIEWMLTKADRQTLLKFVLDKRPPSKRLAAHYKMTVVEAERDWRSWLYGREDQCIKGCPIHKEMKLAKMTPTVPKEDIGTLPRPILYVASISGCIPCLRFKNDYYWDGGFQSALEKRADVVQLDGRKHGTWLNKQGIYTVPAFVLRIGIRNYAVKGYPGKVALVARLDGFLANYAEKYQKKKVEIPPPPITTNLMEKDPIKTNPPVETKEPVETNINKVTPVIEKVKPVIEKVKPVIEKVKPVIEKVKPVVEVITGNSKESGGSFPWGTVITVAASAFGIGIPTYALVAYRGYKVAKRLRQQLKEAKDISSSVGDSAVVPPSASVGEPTNPQPIDYSNDSTRYPGATGTAVVVTDAPSVRTEAPIETRFVEVETNSYQRAHEEARSHIARRWPNSAGILEAELNLTRQFFHAGDTKLPSQN